MSSDATEMFGSDPSKATHAKIASVQPASAAMPSEEDVARAIAAFRKHLNPESKIDILPSEMAQAAAVKALFAPILAEKENLACNLDAIQSDHADTLAMLIEANAERRALNARALAAEAALAAMQQEIDRLEKERDMFRRARNLAESALAAERERCAKVVEGWAEEHAAHLADDAPSPIGRHRAAMNDGYALAAAIRAQGE